MPKKTKWIRISTAAKMRGVARQTMYYHIDANNIKTMELDGVMYVDQDAVHEMKPARSDAGQAKKRKSKPAERPSSDVSPNT